MDAADSHLARARAALGLGRYAEALIEARAAVADAPDDPIPLCALSVALEGSGDLDAAERAARDAVRVAPSSATAHFRVAACCRARGDRAGALAAYEATWSLAPGSAAVNAHLGHALSLVNREPDRARDLLNRAAVGAGGDAEVLQTIACGWIELGPTDRAVQAARAAIEAAPGLAESHRLLAEAWLRGNHYPEALAAAREAIGLQPNLVKAWSASAVALLHIGRHDEAELAARESTRLAPRWWHGWYWSMRTQLARDALGEAWRTYETAKHAVGRDAQLDSIRPRLHAATLARAGLHTAKRIDPRAPTGVPIEHLRGGRSRDALRDAEATLARSPHDAAAHETAAIALADMERIEDAVREAEAAVTADPRRWLAWVWWVELLLMQGAYELALDVAEKAMVATDGTHLEITPLRHRVHAVRTAVANARATPGAGGPTASAVDATTLAVQQRHAQALEHATDAVERAPHDAAAWSHRARVLSDLGRFVEAEAAARQATRLAPADARGWIALVEALLGAGDFARAMHEGEEAMCANDTDARIQGLRARVYEAQQRTGRSSAG